MTAKEGRKGGINKDEMEVIRRRRLRLLFSCI
jgi:hypothetical protein